MLKFEDLSYPAGSYMFDVIGIVLVSLFLTYFTPFSRDSIINFDQGNAGWFFVV